MLSPDPSQLVGDSHVLKEKLAIAFGVNLAKLEQVLADHKYILTFDVRRRQSVAWLKMPLVPWYR